MADERHDPTYHTAAPYVNWCRCTCGWASTYGSQTRAQLAHVRHVLDVLDRLRPDED